MTELHPRTIPDGPVIFDCDGTLVSTEGAWDKAYATLFTRHQRKLARTDRHRLVGLTRIDLGHELARLLDLPGQHTALGDEVIALVTSNHGQGVTAMPGVTDLLAGLAGRRLLGVASNTLRGIVEQYLIQLGLADLFAVIAGSDNVAAPKPAPDVYRYACEQLGADPRTAIAVEDSALGAQAARAAGLYVIGVPSQPDMPLPAAHMEFPTLADPRLRNMLLFPSDARRTA
ncbi:HAD family phosphatase [Dactylosporangium sp. NPDC051485]|uniref:HAD family hydrolase n=1 Tax=Dactylosporangium sp. NPDC051485 TaxID=3154846 RepID=UPI003425DDA6